MVCIWSRVVTGGESRLAAESLWRSFPTSGERWSFPAKPTVAFPYPSRSPESSAQDYIQPARRYAETEQPLSVWRGTERRHRASIRQLGWRDLSFPLFQSGWTHCGKGRNRGDTLPTLPEIQSDIVKNKVKCLRWVNDRSVVERKMEQWPNISINIQSTLEHILKSLFFQWTQPKRCTGNLTLTLKKVRT